MGPYHCIFQPISTHTIYSSPHAVLLNIITTTISSAFQLIHLYAPSLRTKKSILPGTIPPGGLYTCIAHIQKASLFLLKPQKACVQPSLPLLRRLENNLRSEHSLCCTSTLYPRSPSIQSESVLACVAELLVKFSASNQSAQMPSDLLMIHIPIRIRCLSPSTTITLM
jgi:hypothetical protein